MPLLSVITAARRGREAYSTPLPYGEIQPGAIYRAFRSDGQCPVHCAGLMASVEVVRALGGWLALPAGEDMVLVAALGELASGWHSPAVTWLYRHHEGQMTHDQSLDERCRELGVRASLQRVEALRHMRRGGLGAEFSTGE